MWFQISVVELSVAAAALVILFTASRKRAALRRWAAVAPLAVLAAAAITPADPLSAVLVGGLCLLFYAVGSVRLAPQAGRG